MSSIKFSVYCWATGHSQQRTLQWYSLCKFMSPEIIKKKELGLHVNRLIFCPILNKFGFARKTSMEAPFVSNATETSLLHSNRWKDGHYESNGHNWNLRHINKKYRCIKHVSSHIINYQHVPNTSIHVYLLVLWHKFKYSFCARTWNMLMGTFCYFAKTPKVFDTITYQKRTLFIFSCCSQRVIY
jgi:hypothetical protein